MKNIFKRPLSPREKNIAISATILAISCIPAAGIGFTLGHLKQTHEKIVALHALHIYSAVIKEQSDELMRSSNAQIELLEQNIKDTQYITDQAVADSLKNVYTQKQLQILNETKTKIEHNVQALKQFAKENNINLNR